MDWIFLLLLGFYGWSQEVHYFIDTSSQIKPPAKMSLLRWKKVSSPMEAAPEFYNRKIHFGGWIAPGGNCRNARALVLERDSQEEIQYKKPKLCTVDKGRWWDPYTGQFFQDANSLQIDHLVPLKNAFETGGWRWSTEERCHFANNLDNPQHLLAIEGIENMNKGHQGPENYLPPNKNFTCDYLREWLTVKMIWNLAIPQTEAEGIALALASHQCAPGSFQIDHASVMNQIKLRSQIPAACRTKANP